jgi:sugar (pentulose or hexulose) kinase
MTYFIGLDIGTTSVKAAIYDAGGESLGSGSEDYRLETPRVDRVEIDPQHYWTSACGVLRRVVEEAAVHPGAIAALAVSSQGETTIAVDREGNPLYPALVWLDNRAKDESKELAERLGPQVYDRTGIPTVNPTWTACKIAWLRDHEPQIFAQAHQFLLAQNFIIHRLTGRFVTDGGVACSSLLMDIRNYRWWDEALRATGISSSRLPALKRVGEIAGGLTRTAGDALGFPPGVPVVLAGMDQIAGAVGAGNLEPEIISESTGGALTIQVTIENPGLDPTRRTPVYTHALPGKYLLDPVCDTGGMALKWFRDVFCELEMEIAQRQGQDAYDLLTHLAGEADPGSDGLIMLPHLAGAFSPEYDPQARGVFYGFTLAHSKAHFARAVLEAVAYMLRRNLELIAGSGIHVREIRATGGGARSRLWRQIKADVCDLPVVSLRHDDAALLGDAMIAAVATGRFPSLPAAAEAMVTLDERVEPDPGNREIYDSAYDRYVQLYGALAPLFDEHFA